MVEAFECFDWFLLLVVAVTSLIEPLSTPLNIGMRFYFSATFRFFPLAPRQFGWGRRCARVRLFHVLFCGSFSVISCPFLCYLIVCFIISLRTDTRFVLPSSFVSTTDVGCEFHTCANTCLFSLCQINFPFHLLPTSLVVGSWSQPADRGIIVAPAITIISSSRTMPRVVGALIETKITTHHQLGDAKQCAAHRHTPSI